MGVKGAHQFIKEKRITFKKYNNIQEFAASIQKETIYVDLFGFLFYKIKKMLHQGKKEALLDYLVKLFKVSLYC